MTDAFDHLSWRGIELDHPHAWELTRASAPEKPAQATWSDRRYERLKLQWRIVNFTPNLRKTVEDRRRRDGDANVRPLDGQPAEWHGVWEPAGRGTLVHAGRYFEAGRMLVEAVMIWPQARDGAVENRVLESVRLPDPAAPERLWLAMGMKMTLPREFDLAAFDGACGRTSWTFGPAGGRPAGRSLTVRRLAIPRYWLNMPLEDWLDNELPPGSEVLRKGRTTWNGHGAAELASIEPGRGWDRLRGRWPMRLDLAQP